MIFGRPGGGKSTFSLWLHQQTGIPLHHLDAYFYEENWIERNYEEFLKIQQEIVDQDQWIIDGNMTKSLEMRYQRATHCFYLNYPLWLCYYRVLKRRFWKKSPDIKDRAPGCSEIIQWKFLMYIWDFQKRVQTALESLPALYPQVIFKEIRSDKDLEALKEKFLRSAFSLPIN
jgi:adenylate kinase family enzyme